MTNNAVPDGKTVLAVAREIGTTKGAVQKRMAREPLKTSIYGHIYNVNGTKMLDETAVSMLKEAFLSKQKEASTDASTPMGTDAAIDIGTGMYDFLIKQIEEKDKQIVEKDKQIELLLQQNDQAQQLQLQLMKNVQLLTGPSPAEGKKRSWFKRRNGGSEND